MKSKIYIYTIAAFLVSSFSIAAADGLIPYLFTPGGVIKASEVNQNFKSLAAAIDILSQEDNFTWTQTGRGVSDTFSNGTNGGEVVYTLQSQDLFSFSKISSQMYRVIYPVDMSANDQNWFVAANNMTYQGKVGSVFKTTINSYSALIKPNFIVASSGAYAGCQIIVRLDESTYGSLVAEYPQSGIVSPYFDKASQQAVENFCKTLANNMSIQEI